MPINDDLSWQERLGGVESELRRFHTDFERLQGALDTLIALDRRLANVAFDEKAIIGEMLSGIVDLTRAKHAQILAVRGSALEIAHSTQSSDLGRTFALAECLTGLATETRRTIATGNIERDYPDRYMWVLGVGEGRRMQSEVCVPILARGADDGIVVGVLNVESPEVDAFARYDVSLVERLAQQAGTILHNLRVYRGMQLTLDFALATQHGIMTHPLDALRATLEKLSAYFRNSIVQFLVLDGEDHTLVIECSTARETEGFRVLVSESICGRVVSTLKAIKTGNARRDFPDLFRSTIGDLAGIPTISELAVPVLDGDRIVGVLNLESSDASAYSDHDEYVLRNMATYAAIWVRARDPLKRAAAAEHLTALLGLVANFVHMLKNNLTPIRETAKKVRLALTSTAAPAQLSKLDELVLQADRVIQLALDQQDKYRRALEEPKPTDLNSLIRDEVDEYITRPEVQVNLEKLDPQLPELNLSPAIRDLVGNLLSNAYGAIASREGHIAVETERVLGKYTRRDEAVLIRVKDDGVGIPPDALSRIYDADYSSHKDTGGTGFGLWFVRRFLDQIGGTIECESSLGKGTTFTIRIPLTTDLKRRKGVTTKGT